MIISVRPISAPSGRFAKAVDRTKEGSLPSSRENTGVIDDIEVEKMRTAMDASPEDKAIAMSLQREASPDVEQK